MRSCGLARSAGPHRIRGVGRTVVERETRFQHRRMAFRGVGKLLQNLAFWILGTAAFAQCPFAALPRFRSPVRGAGRPRRPLPQPRWVAVSPSPRNGTLVAGTSVAVRHARSHVDCRATPRPRWLRKIAHSQSWRALPVPWRGPWSATRVVATGDRTPRAPELANGRRPFGRGSLETNSGKGSAADGSRLPALSRKSGNPCTKQSGAKPAGRIGPTRETAPGYRSRPRASGNGALAPASVVTSRNVSAIP